MTTHIQGKALYATQQLNELLQLDSIRLHQPPCNFPMQTHMTSLLRFRQYGTSHIAARRSIYIKIGLLASLHMQKVLVAESTYLLSD